MPTVFVLVFSIVFAGTIPADAQDDRVEELSILEALLADPATIQGWSDIPLDLRSGAIEVSPKTDRDPAVSWLRDPKKAISVRSIDAMTYLPVVPEAVADAVRRNRRSLSLAGIRLPAGLKWAPSSRIAGARLTFSRPGLSSDGLHAVVEVVIDRESGPLRGGRLVYQRTALGYTAYLKKVAGSWTVIGRNIPWLT